MKYKIGQMVQLSAAGHKRQHNGNFVRSGFGIVLEYSSYQPFPYSIKWFNKGRMKAFSAKEYEIKKVKTPKSK